MQTRLSSRNPWMRFAALVVVFLVLAIAWYLISPLFVDMEVDEGFPTLAHMPTKTAKAEQTEEAQAHLTQTAASLGFSPAQATAAMQSAQTEEPSRMEEPMPEGTAEDSQVYARGEFYDVAHHGEGTATIYLLADGSRLLRFENFEVLNGPDLHVYLAPQDPVSDSVGVELAGAADLGTLKGNIGDQNYLIPAHLDINLYKSVVIWCEPFRVPFSAAPLTPQELTNE